jgi:hypothetical protein
MKRIETGDTVRYTRNFLQSVGWTTDVPDNGKVLSVKTVGPKKIAIARVQWSDSSEPMGINCKNLIVVGDSHKEQY